MIPLVGDHGQPQILTGDEAATNGAGVFVPLIYAIDTNGVVTTNELGIAPENFNIIPANQDLYCTDASSDRILKLSRTCSQIMWATC